MNIRNSLAIIALAILLDQCCLLLLSVLLRISERLRRGGCSSSAVGTMASKRDSSTSGAVDFSTLKMDSHEPLHAAAERVTCTGCNKSRRYWCCDCAKALVDGAPSVHLPLQVSIVQAAAELPKRSTAQHAQILSDDARVYRPFPNCEEGVRTLLAKHEPGSAALLYPSDDACTPEEAISKLPDLKHLIVIGESYSLVSV